MLDTDTAYVAGLFDGEGCILISTRLRCGRPIFWLDIVITNTDKPVLDWLLITVGGRMSKKPYNKNGNRDIWRWKTSSRKAASVLRALLPYLRIKHEQAVIAIEFQMLLSSKTPGAKSTPDEIATLGKYRQKLLAIRKRVA